MQLISAGYENTKYFSNRFELQECGDFTWKVPDWCRHLRKHLGINATNYFMYQWAGPVCSPPGGGQIRVQVAPASQSSRCTAPHQ